MCVFVCVYCLTPEKYILLVTVTLQLAKWEVSYHHSANEMLAQTQIHWVDQDLKL